tara:strand:+ start:69 stop:437 length:369 start_codon:yes stop_codon:yes gene_type:complete
MREACGTTCDENEEHEDALFVVLVLPPLLALLFAVVKKVRKVSLLVFAFVRILVVVAKPPLLVKEVIIIITERERLFQFPRGRTTDQNVVIPYTPPPFVSLERSNGGNTNNTPLSFISLSRL